jgi:hypothetical protein
MPTFNEWLRAVCDYVDERIARDDECQTHEIPWQQEGVGMCRLATSLPDLRTLRDECEAKARGKQFTRDYFVAMRVDQVYAGVATLMGEPVPGLKMVMFHVEARFLMLKRAMEAKIQQTRREPSQGD